MVWAIWSGVFIVLATALVLSKIRLQVTFIHKEQNDEITIDFRVLYGLIRFRFAIPVLKFKGMAEGLEIKTEQVNEQTGNLLEKQKEKINYGKIKEVIENYKLLMRNCFHFDTWFARLLSYIRCEHFNWKTSVGVGDAAETAFVVGALWGLKTSLIAYLSRFIMLETQPQLQIMPAFNTTVFITEGSISLHIRSWYILIAVPQLLFRILKIKGGLKVWQHFLTRTWPLGKNS